MYTTTELVCFSSSTICVPPTVEITLQVDISNEIVSPKGVHIGGDFQGWDPRITQMQDDWGIIYSYITILNVDEYYEFKYINGITWDDEESVPGECNLNDNRFFTGPDVNTSFDLVLF